jgi:iron complex transport system ATP-binding protein
MSGQEVLQVEGLSFSYTKEKTIFQDISFTLHRGDILSILGANGCGKTTLLSCLGNLLKPDAGHIRIEGKNIAEMSARELAKKLALVRQNIDAACEFRGLDMVVMGRTPYIGFLQMPSAEEFEKAYAALAALGVSEYADKIYSQMSGGEKRMIQIASALAQDTDIILLDEPTNHLDFGNQHKILDVLSSLAASGKCIVMTTHVPDHAILLGGKTAVMDGQGSILLGSSEEIITEERLREIYHIDLDVVYVPEAGRKACISRRLKGDSTRGRA